MPTKNFKDFWPGSLLEDRAGILRDLIELTFREDLIILVILL